MRIWFLAAFVLLLIPATGCDQSRQPAPLPIETHAPPSSGDLDLGGHRFDEEGNITHIKDDETGEWIELDDEWRKKVTASYREMMKTGLKHKLRGYVPK